VPEIDVEGCRLSYAIDGPSGAPVLLLLHALGTSRALWAPQRDRLRRSFRLVRYDMRGHGESQTPPGDYSLDRLGRDAVAILDAAGARRAHLCGVSLGGLVALWLGVHAPDRVGRLVAANTAARLGTVELWEERIRVVRTLGMDGLADTAPSRWFSERFRRRHADIVDRFRRELTACSVDGYAGSCAALRDADLRADLHRITAETMVVTGVHDRATPPAEGDDLRRRIARCRGLSLEAAHLSNVEQPQAFTEGLVDFLLNESGKDAAVSARTPESTHEG